MQALVGIQQIVINCWYICKLNNKYTSVKRFKNNNSTAYYMKDIKIPYIKLGYTGTTVWTHIHAQFFIHMQLNTHTHTQPVVYKQMNTHTHACPRAQMHSTKSIVSHAQMYTHTVPHALLHMYTFLHAQMHTHIHAFPHAQMHTHTHVFLHA